ncbi:MAG TPA: phosphodiester glycosidase family protein [Puia sp.]|nr:phosphodiester glycosidase family protein [Puia sp.]
MFRIMRTTDYKPQTSFVLFLAVMFVSNTSIAQLHWHKVDSLFSPLPSSVHIYKTTDSLNRRPFIAYYASVKLKDKKLLFTTQVGNGYRYTPQQYYEQEAKPLLIVNGGFFSYETNQNLNVVVKNGKMIGYNVQSLVGSGSDSFMYYYPTRSAIGISHNRKADVAWIFTDSLRHWPYAFEWRPVVAKGWESNPSIYDLNDINWKWWKMRTAVGGGPTLIHDGEIWITNKEEQILFTENELRPATAMGYTNDERLIILVVQGRFSGISEGISLQEEAKILKDIGCYEALNLDGGGSTCMLVNGMQTITPSDKEGQRPVASVFIVKVAPEKK